MSRPLKFSKRDIFSTELICLSLIKIELMVIFLFTFKGG